MEKDQTITVTWILKKIDHKSGSFEVQFPFISEREGKKRYCLKSFPIELLPIEFKDL